MELIRKVMRRLRQELPTHIPVVVRRRTGIARDSLGYCTRQEDHFCIVIDAKLSQVLALNVLVHEYAHALSWTPEHPSFEDHGPEWGVAYAKVYQVAYQTT